MFAAVDRPHDETTAALVEYLLVKQRKDGAWPIAPLGDRPPTMGSLFTNVGLAISVLKKYGPPEDDTDEKAQARIDAALTTARPWLLANEPASTEAKVFHLRALVDAIVDSKHIERLRAGLVKDQREDGAGDSLPRWGRSLCDRHGAVAATRAWRRPDKRINRALNSCSSLSVTTGVVRADAQQALQMYFDNGDSWREVAVHSFAATNWAVLLLDTLP